MGQTDLWDIRYPETTDENDVPTDMAEMAADIESGLGRAFECTAATRPTGVPSGFIIRETDTGDWLGYSGVGWVALSASGVGGGGSTGGGRHSAGGVAQSIPNTTSGPGTVLALGTAETAPLASTLLTRTVEGAGHKFELGGSGMWACGATVRAASSTAAGELSADIVADIDGGGYDLVIAKDGSKREGLPRTLCPSRTLYLPSGTKVLVYIYNGTGTARTLEPNAGAWVHLDLWLVG